MEYTYYVLREFGTMKYVYCNGWEQYELVEEPCQATLWKTKMDVKSFLEDIFLPDQEKFTVCAVNMKVTITNLE